MTDDVDRTWWSVVLLKPDCVARDLVDPVLAQVSAEVAVVNRRIITATEDQIIAHYTDLLTTRLAYFTWVDVATDLRREYAGHQVGIALACGRNAAPRLRDLHAVPEGAATMTVPLGTGPRTLPTMSDDAKAALDPYMSLIVGYRKSGLSLNHIIGCPLDCGYCVRHFWGNFEAKIPHLLCSTDEAIDQLTSHHAFQAHVTPIQLFNKATDPFLPGVKPHLFQVLRALDSRGYTNHVLVITRFKVTESDMAALEELRHLRVTLLFTYSGITDARVEPIAKSDITRASIRTAATHKQRTGVVLYWRPIVPGWNDAPETMAGVLDTGRDVDAIVFTGYYRKRENAHYLREQGVDVPFADDYARRKVMPQPGSTAPTWSGTTSVSTGDSCIAAALTSSPSP